MGASRDVSRVQLASYFVHVIVARRIAEVVAVPFNVPVVGKRRGQQVEKGRRFVAVTHRSGSTYATTFQLRVARVCQVFQTNRVLRCEKLHGEGGEARRITTEVIRVPVL